MQVDLDSRDLVSALSRLFFVWEQKPKLPKDSFLRISRGEGQGFLRLSVFSPTMEAHALVKATIHDSGAFATPLSVVMPLSKVLPEGRAKLTFKDGKGFLKVGSGSYQLSLAADLAIFPDSRPEEWDFKPLKIVPFLRSLTHVCACAVDNGRSYSDLVYVDAKDFAATDSYRLAVSPNDGFQAEGPIVMTGDFARKAIKLFGNTAGEAGISWDQSSVYIKRGGLSVAARLSSQTFPAFRSVIPRSTPQTATLPLFNLTQALRRLTLVAGTRSLPVMTLSFSEYKLSILATGDSGEVSTEDLACQGDVAGQTTVNGRYLLEALCAFQLDDIKIEFRGSKMPLIITDGTSLHVLQPIGTS